MPDDTKAAQVSKEGETKPTDPAKQPIKIVDITDQLPE